MLYIDINLEFNIWSNSLVILISKISNVVLFVIDCHLNNDLDISDNLGQSLAYAMNM